MTTHAQFDTKPLLNAQHLKWFAMVAMVIDHVAWLFLNSETWLAEVCHLIGRSVMPMMAYFIASGYFYTKSKKAYIKRLLMFGVMAQPLNLLMSHLIGYDSFVANILFSFAVCLMVMCGLDWYIAKISHIKSNLDCLMAGVLSMAVIGVLYGIHQTLHQAWAFTLGNHTVWFLGLEYGGHLLLSVLYLWACIRFDVAYRLMVLGFFVVLAISFWAEHGMLNPDVGMGVMNVGWLLAVVMLWLYNGQQGKQTGGRWVFYWFYPVHLLVLIMIAFLADMPWTLLARLF